MQRRGVWLHGFGMRKVFLTLWMGILAALLCGCATRTVERPENLVQASGPQPLNLSLAKAAIEAYYDEGDYERDLNEVAEQLIAWLRSKRVVQDEPGPRAAVVFDLDETLLCNRQHMRAQDYGYVPEVWDAYVEAGIAQGIEPMIEAAREAHRLGYVIFYITGRPEAARESTERNLRQLGLPPHERLVMTADHSGTTSQAKTAARRVIKRDDFRIVANIGDQWSDLEGGYAERLFLVPNPIYRIP